MAVAVDPLQRKLREANVRHGGISRNGQAIEIRLRDSQTLAATRRVLQDQFPDLQATEQPDGTEYKLVATGEREMTAIEKIPVKVKAR